MPILEGREGGEGERDRGRERQREGGGRGREEGEGEREGGRGEREGGREGGREKGGGGGGREGERAGERGSMSQIHSIYSATCILLLHEVIVNELGHDGDGGCTRTLLKDLSNVFVL